MFKKAERRQLRLRSAIDGPSGSGKTATALRFALALSPAKKIAVIDSEHGSASKYIGQDFGEGPVEFDVLELSSFSPSNYTSAIQEAGRLGYEVIVVDSLSHAWEGKDGALELVDKAGGSSFTAWKDVTPMHRNMIEAILASPAHVICTMRSKTEYVMEEQDRNGKKTQVPRKVGMAPVQRAGMEYEFDVYLSMDLSHIGTVTKSRCSAVDGVIAAKPGREFLSPVIGWLTTGAVPSETTTVASKISDAQLSSVASLLNELGWKPNKLDKELPKRFSVTAINALDASQGEELIRWLNSEKKIAAEKAERAKASAEKPNVGPAASNGTTAPAAAQPVSSVQPTAQADVGANLPSSPAPSSAASQPPTPATPPFDTSDFVMSPPADPITAPQIEDIKVLKSQLYAELLDQKLAAEKAGDVTKAKEIADTVNQKWLAALAKRKVTTAKNLSRDQAAELIESIAKVVKARELAKKNGELNDWANGQVSKNLASGQQKTESATATTGKA